MEWWGDSYSLGYAPTDADAIAYIAAVQVADGQGLEDDVKRAIDDFIIGCKTDGIWSAIKASCILAGARTLAGALVPLVGTAPTNINFTSPNYNRKTGLIGTGAAYLNTNRNLNADPQNNCHQAVWKNDNGGSGNQYWMGAGLSGSGVYTAIGIFGIYCNSSGAVSANSSALGLHGAARSSSSSFNYKRPGAIATSATITSATPSSFPTFVFGVNNSGSLLNASTSRLAFYSIGESINLNQLDSRVSALLNAIAAAIP